jgi:hypothetical protein
MSIAGAYRVALRRGHRVERRNRRRLTRRTAIWLASLFGWCFAFIALCWLVAAGFYGLLMNA